MEEGGGTGQVSVSFPCYSAVQAPEFEEETEKRRRKMTEMKRRREREVIRIQ